MSDSLKRQPAKFSVPITCVSCGLEAPRTGPVQKYCPSCSEKKDIERKMRWRSKSGRHSDPNAIRLRTEKSQQERDRLQSRGLVHNKEAKRGIFWPANVDDDLVWNVRVAVPFSWGFSKNSLFTMNTRSGHVFIRQKARALRDQLTYKVKEAVKGQTIYRGKVWLDIMVQKPNNKGDAVNVVDTVCDAVKVAIGIDDRYFSIRKLDWEIVKESPMLYIGIGQSIEEHHFVCTYCGILQPESQKASHRITCKKCRFKAVAP